MDHIARARHATTAACLLFVGLAGCSALGLGSSARRTEKIVDQAVALAREGDVDAAIAHVEDEFGSSPRGEAAFMRFYTLGRLYEERSKLRASLEDLDRAEAMYSQALELERRPNVSVKLALLLSRRGRDRIPEAIDVLERARDQPGPDGVVDPTPRFVRLVAIGDLHVELASTAEPFDREQLELALASYDEACELQPDDDLAAVQTVAAYTTWRQLGGSDEWLVGLEAHSEKFAQTGSLAAARAGYEQLIGHAVVTADEELATSSLEAWLRIEARAGSFSADALAQLPAAELWPESRAAAVKELHELVAAPGRADILEAWGATALRRQILAELVQSLGARAAVEGDFARAAELYEVSREVAPGLAAYLPRTIPADQVNGDGHTRKPPELEGERLVRLDVSLDLLLLIQGYPREADPDRSRFGAVLSDELFEREKLEQIAGIDLAGLQRLHTVLGLIFADQGDWGTDERERWTDPWWTAPPHLRQAMVVAGRNPDVPRGRHERPLPHLAALLGDGLRAPDRAPEAAVTAYLDAALGYDDLGDGYLSREAFENAESVAGELVASNEAEVRRVEDLLGIRRGGFFPPRWLEQGWYVGAAVGRFASDRDGGDLERDLAELGHDVTTTYEGVEYGGKVVIGYQFEKPFAIEFGYTNMGEIESDIVDNSPPPVDPDLADDISRVHPVLGDGFTLALRANLWGGGPVTVTGRIGAWAWDANKEIAIPGGADAKIDEKGFDLFFGLGAIFGNWKNFSATVDLERYFLDGDGVTALSFGALYSFGK